MYKLLKGDCLEVMKDIPDGSIDLILCDPPYGTIKGQGNSPASKQHNYKNCEWDICIEPTILFKEYSRILRQNGKCILFSQEPYTSKLINNAIKSLPFSYRAIWLKNGCGNHLKVNKAMLCKFEDICIFQKINDDECKNELRIYFKKVLNYINKTKKEIIQTIGQKADHCFRINSSQYSLCTEETYRELIHKFNIDKMNGFLDYGKLKEINIKYESRFNLWENKKCKYNVLEYKKDNEKLHPTQKPVLLLEDLIKTFSNENDIVLDNCMGSGSTGVACINTNRNFIGIELDNNYFEIAKNRIEDVSNSKLQKEVKQC